MSGKGFAGVTSPGGAKSGWFEDGPFRWKLFHCGELRWTLSTRLAKAAPNGLFDMILGGFYGRPPA